MLLTKSVSITSFVMLRERISIRLAPLGSDQWALALHLPK